MSRAVTILTQLSALGLAVLLVLWPALCCCGFACGGKASPASVAAQAEAPATPACHGGGGTRGKSGGCHGSQDDAGQRGDGDSRTCGCEKSSSTVAKVDAGSLDRSSLPQFAAWLPAVERFAHRRDFASSPFARAAERARPPPLSQLCVLRI